MDCEQLREHWMKYVEIKEDPGSCEVMLSSSDWHCHHLNHLWIVVLSLSSVLDVFVYPHW